MPFDLKRRDFRHDGRYRLCLPVTLASAILLFVIILTICLTLRPRHAVTTVNSIRLSSFAASFDVTSLSVDLNVTLAVNATVFNPNRVAFRYPNGGTAQLYYRDELAGDAAIPPGEVGAKGTETVDVELTVFADRLIGDVEVYKDLVRGSLNLTTFTRIRGRVKILGVKHRVTTYSTCHVRVSVRNRTVDNSDCKYRTKI